MKTRCSFYAGSCLVMLAMMAGITDSRSAPSREKAAPTAAQANTNSVPQSIFTVPASRTQGRDPFFPDSTYWLGGGSVTPIVSPKQHIEAALVLNGLSGTPDHRLAMINGRTMAEGEEAEVPISSGRLKVRCLIINSNSAVVEIGGQRQELRLKE
jgi:hypothetical protein